MKIGGSKRELFVPLFLDMHNHLIAYDVYRGSVNQNNVTPREIVTQCLLCGASKLIIAHNHPSGVWEPSQADIHFTRTLKMLLKALDIQLTDHLIVTGSLCHSIMPLIELYEKKTGI